MAVTAVVVASVGAIPKAAEAKSGPYRASTWMFNNCAEGATCEVDASATRAGEQRASASIERTTPVKTEHETPLAEANGSTWLHLRQAVPELKVTFAWTVVSADASATRHTAEGSVLSRVLLRGEVDGCAACTRTYEFTGGQSHGAKGTIPIEALAELPGAKDTATITDHQATHTVVLRGANGGVVPAGRYELTGTTVAVATVRRYCKDCVEVEGHAGTAQVSVAANLTSITVG